MFDQLYQILKLLRPRQWVKNIFLFAAIIFGGQLFDANHLIDVTLGFIAFCLLASSAYIINDLKDVEKDRLHPFKKGRPIASGKVSVLQAVILFIVLVTTSLVLAASIEELFFLIAVFYIILQITYSYFLKSIAIFDILVIALGYILRVLAGEVITGYHISAWLLLTTVSLSLFLAVAKRRSELTLLQGYDAKKIQAIRSSLSHYSENLLNAFSTMFATCTFIFYSFFTFLEDPAGIKIQISLLLPDFLPYYLQRKWLMITILPVIYGLMRYMQDIYEKNEGESPEKVILADRQLLASVIIWGFLVVFIIYVIGG